MGQKEGTCRAPFAEELVSRLTQCGLSRGPYQVASSSIQPFGDNRHLQKTGGVPLLGGAVTPSNITSPVPRFTSVLSGILVHPAVWPMATIDMGQKLGGAVLFSGGSWVPIEHKVAWAQAYHHTKWHFRPSSRLATTHIVRKLGVCAFLGEGQLGPRLTQCRLD